MCESQAKWLLSNIFGDMLLLKMSFWAMTMGVKAMGANTLCTNIISSCSHGKNIENVSESINKSFFSDTLLEACLAINLKIVLHNPWLK